MTLRAIGFAICALPFVGITILMARSIGWRGVAVVWLGVLGVTALLYLGVYLIVRGG